MRGFMGLDKNNPSIISPKKSIRFWDKLGVLVSSLCIVHCILLPVVIIAFPAVASFLGLSEDNTHFALMAFLLPATAFAVYSGFKVHGQFQPLIWLGVGLGLVVLGTIFAHNFLGHHWEFILVTLGSVSLVRGHILNSHHCKRCEEEHHCIWEHADTEDNQRL